MKKLILAAIMALIVSPVLADLEWDKYWSINEPTSTLVARIVNGAGNTFGLFDKANPANKLPVFVGSDDIGDIAMVTILGDVPGGILLRSIDLDTPNPGDMIVGTATFAANAFGYYVTTGVGDTMHTTVLVPGGEYQLNWGGFVVDLESVHPIPEPATLCLLGLGGLVLRKRKA
jgi:hypothetical protein